MSQQTKRSAKEGIGLGIVAGIIFAMMEMIGSAVMGNPPLMPLHMFASLVMGMDAMEAQGTGVLILGAIVHLVLSAAFGLVYGLVNARFSTKAQTSFGSQAGIGVLFGLALWFVNFQIIARIAFPWFLDAPQFLQALMHAAFFGLPLALMYAGAERRAHHFGHAPGSRA